MQTALIIREPKVKWYRRLADGAYECHACSTGDSGETALPPWLSEAPIRKPDPVALVIDHPGEEIDVQPLQRPGNRLRRWHTRHALTATLQTRYPSAETASLKLNKDSDAVVVTHRHWPPALEQWCARLGSVQAGSAETLGRLLARFTPMAGNSFYYLVVEAGVCRHVYCRNRLCLFSRHVSISTDESVLQQYSECCAHLEARGLLDDSPVLVTAGLPEALGVGIRDCLSSRELLDLDELLPACNDTDMLSLAAAVTCLERQRHARVPRLAATCIERLAGASFSALPRWDPWIEAARREQDNRLYRQRMLTALAVLTLAGAVGGYRTHTALQLLRSDNQFIAELESAINQVSTRASELDATPELTAQILEAREQLNERNALAPGEALRMLARLLSEFEALSLSSLEWQSDRAASTAAGAGAYSLIEHTDSERVLPDSADRATRWRLMLHGVLSAQESLRRRQELLEEFSGRLQQMPEVVDVEILESVVDSEQLPTRRESSEIPSGKLAADSGFLLRLTVVPGSV